MPPRRVAITGLGIISPLGLNLAANWESLREGRSGIGPIQSVNLALFGLRISNGAEVRGFDASKHFQSGREDYLDRFAQFSVVAAREALQDSGLQLTPELRQRGAIVCGSAVGGQMAIEKGFEDLYVTDRGRVHPLTIPKTMANAGASHISMELGLSGPDVHGFDGVLFGEPRNGTGVSSGARRPRGHGGDGWRRGDVHDRHAESVGSDARDLSGHLPSIQQGSPRNDSGRGRRDDDS